MGDAGVVPRKVEKWAYGGDSIAGSGYIGENNPKNTDIGTQISKFTNKNIQFDNYGRSSDSTRGMLGQYEVKGKRRDMVGKMLEGDYEGIIIEVGVNDLAAGGGCSKEAWEGNPEKEIKGKRKTMRKNLVTMYVRTFLKGAGAGNREEVLGKIDSGIKKIREEESRVAEALESGKARNREGFRWRMEKKKRMLEESRGILEDAKEAYGKYARGGRMPGKPVKRVIFVEVAPWKGYASWSEKKGLRTFEYNTMLKDVEIEMNAFFGELGGPEMEVAEVHDSLASTEDGMKLHNEYLGSKKGGKDYLHFGAEGRRAAAAVIALEHFPNQVTEPQKVEAIASGNQPAKEKKPGALALK
jgi:hypothetical protein